ncbi:MAG: hypothetical protein CMM07_03875 [Rhodopirellula sp.]|nr:hypothetical protein [Rhodopirellula sp.]
MEISRHDELTRLLNQHDSELIRYITAVLQIARTLVTSCRDILPSTGTKVCNFDSYRALAFLAFGIVKIEIRRSFQTLREGLIQVKDKLHGCERNIG